MKTDTKQVQDLILLYVNDYYSKRQEIVFSLKGRINLGKMNGLFNGSLIINLFTKKDLYFLTKAFYKATKETAINPENFFTPLEVTEFESSPLEIESQEKNNVIVLHNVYETIPGKIWSCTRETYANLTSPFENGLIGYDKRMQRETEKSKLFNKVVERAKVYTENVRQMTELMKKGIFIPDPITINILNNGDAEFYYDEKEHTLTIVVTTKSQVYLIDGIHRELSMINAKQENPKCADNIMTASIFHYTIAESQQWINQQNQRTPVSKEKLATFNIENQPMLIAKEINGYETEASNALFNKLAFEYSDVELLEKYCTLNTFAKAIEDNFKIETQRDQRLITEYLIKFFNEVLGVFHNDTKNITQSRIENIKLHNYTFTGYVALAGVLYKEKDWITILDCILEEIDWNLNNPVWKKLRITQEDLKPKQISDIRKFFIDMVKDLVSNQEDESVMDESAIESVDKEKEVL